MGTVCFDPTPLPLTTSPSRAKAVSSRRAGERNFPAWIGSRIPLLLTTRPRQDTAGTISVSNPSFVPVPRAAYIPGVPVPEPEVVAD